jgi:hypothetical protein
MLRSPCILTFSGHLVTLTLVLSLHSVVMEVDNLDNVEVARRHPGGLIGIQQLHHYIAMLGKHKLIGATKGQNQ